MEFFILQLVDFLTSIVAGFYSAINKWLTTGRNRGSAAPEYPMDHHEKWINGKKYFNMDCYFEERDEARRQALAQRAAHLQVVK